MASLEEQKCGSKETKAENERSTFGVDLSNDNFIAIIIEFFPLSIIAENP